MAGVTVFVGMTGMTVVMNMGLCSHRHYSTRLDGGDAALSSAYYAL
jgi:hypothetical protein